MHKISFYLHRSMNNFQSPSDFLQNISQYHQDWQPTIQNLSCKSPVHEKQKVLVLKKEANFVKDNKNILKHLNYHRLEYKIQQKPKISINRIQFPLESQEETIETQFMSKIMFHQQYCPTYGKLSQENIQNAQKSTSKVNESSKARMILFKKMDLQVNRQFNIQEIHYKPKGILLPSLPTRHQNTKVSPIKESYELKSPLLRKRGASMYSLSLLKNS